MPLWDANENSSFCLILPIFIASGSINGTSLSPLSECLALFIQIQKERWALGSSLIELLFMDEFDTRKFALEWRKLPGLPHGEPGLGKTALCLSAGSCSPQRLGVGDRGAQLITKRQSQCQIQRCSFLSPTEYHVIKIQITQISLSNMSQKYIRFTDLSWKNEMI